MMFADAPLDLSLPDASVRYWPCWLAPEEADLLLARLRDEIPWEVHRIRMFGREIDSPRLSCWIGDPGTDYVYSRTRFVPRPWLPALTELRQRLQDTTGVAFNSVLANRYRDGRDAMGWHSDDEPELGAEPVVASVSLGAERRFLFRHRQLASVRHALTLAHGSLLVMAGATQAHWQHALPRTARPISARLNLTFRKIIGD